MADRLQISTRTVQRHLNIIFNKLSVGSRTEAIFQSVKRGWLSFEDLALGKTSLTADEIREEVRAVTAKVRRFSQELRISILDDLGLVPAVKWLADDLMSNYGIMVRVEVKGKPRKLAGETELMLFRIIQEALTNVRKHSGATEVEVWIDFAEQQIAVGVKDNGKGFEIPASIADLAITGNLGLVGIQERAQLLGGTLNIESRPGRGTSLAVTIPA